MRNEIGNIELRTVEVYDQEGYCWFPCINESIMIKRKVNALIRQRKALTDSERKQPNGLAVADKNILRIKGKKLAKEGKGNIVM